MNSYTHPWLLVRYWGAIPIRINRYSQYYLAYLALRLIIQTNPDWRLEIIDDRYQNQEARFK